MRRDALRGKLEAIQMLRTDTVWPALSVRVKGDKCELITPSGTRGCPRRATRAAASAPTAPSARRAARHLRRCTHRQIAGQPVLAAGAARAHGAAGTQEERVREHLRRLGMVVARRKQCKAIMAEVQGVLEYLHTEYPASDVLLPAGPPPKTAEPICMLRSPGHSARVRFLAQYMARLNQEATADMRELRLSGGMHGGVWGELKALLVMTPQRLLMLGGLKELMGEYEDKYGVKAIDHLNFSRDAPEEEGAAAPAGRAPLGAV